MRFLRPAATITVFLIIAGSIPQSLFSQQPPKPSQPKQPITRNRQPRRQQRADALAPAINELLKLDPLTPESPDEKDSGISSEEETKPPADDAPIKDLIAYWTERNGDTVPNPPKPSDKVRQRLLEAVEDRPELVIRLISFLPDSTDTHDRLYKLLEEDSEDDNYNYWKKSLQEWLQHSSRYFRDDLIAAARRDGSNLTILAWLDWETAKPIIETAASGGDARMMPFALSLLHDRARRDADSPQAEQYRTLLKGVVANRLAPLYARQVALSSLMSTEWNGQEEWFVSLFADPTLGNLREVASGEDSKMKAAPGAEVDRAMVGESEEGESGILVNVLEANSERWLPVINSLVGHNNRTVHLSAVRCLASLLNDDKCDKKCKKEIAQKLAPWLTDPNWAAAEDRPGFIQSLVDLQSPELLSGLVWVLEHDENQDNRAAAAEALTQYRDQRANPALRRALEKEENEENREKIVTALAECGGFSDDEMAAAIEAYAKVVITEEGEQEIRLAQGAVSDKPLPLKVSIGRILRESKTFQATEGLAVRLIERAKALRVSHPALAREILRSVEGVPLRAAEVNLVERIGAGWADIDSLTIALENRDSIRKSAGDELYGLIKQGGYAAGVAAAVLNDEREYREALEGTDAKAQLALLAGARYLRDKLPVELGSKLLASPSRALAKAVEGYLEVEDSAEARKLILARHRGEAYILGDITAMGNEVFIEMARKWEEEMRKEIKGADGLEAIYALARPRSVEKFNGVIIRVRYGKAEISLYEVEGRRAVRPLTESELEELRSVTSRQEIEDLGPESYDGNAGRRNYEYLRLTKGGGRRIVLDGLRRAPKNPTLHEELSGLFHRLSRSGEFVTRYAIEDKIPGVEVLLADKKQEAMMVCGEGSEIRVLIGEKGAQYKSGLAESTPEWREFTSGQPGKVTDDPTACRVLSMIPSILKIRWNDHYRNISLPIRSGDAWVYTSYGEDAAVWKFEPGTEPTKIISGSYISPVITPDGKWLVALKTMDERGGDQSELVRHNLRTGKEFPVKMEKGAIHPPVTYVAAHGKVLLGNSGFRSEAYLGKVNHLLDPETGAVQQVKGEFGALTERFARELQPSGNPNEFWAAIPDEQKKVTRFGRYDSKNFVFTPLVELPELILRSGDFWVDATAGKIWFTYRGHLLRIPLPSKTK